MHLKFTTSCMCTIVCGICASTSALQLISLFTRNGPEASAAAAAFSLLLNDDASRNLTQAGGAMVMVRPNHMSPL